MAAPPPPPRGGLSLYENLLDPNDSSSATISSAPVLYNQTDSAPAETSSKKPVDPALRFQPIRRPQVKQAKPKPSFPKTAGPKPATAAATPPAPAPPKSTLADWAATEDDEWQYGAVEKRQRGGRKKKKKQQQVHMETDWEELYDPARPTNVEEYLRSDEKVNEVREWKALLYRHRRKRDKSDSSDNEDDDGDTRHVAPSKSPSLQLTIVILTPNSRSVCTSAVICICPAATGLTSSSSSRQNRRGRFRPSSGHVSGPNSRGRPAAATSRTTLQLCHNIPCSSPIHATRKPQR